MGELGPCLTQCAWAEVYFRTKWRLHPSSRLATVDMNRKLGSCAPFMGDLRPHLTQRRLGRGLLLYKVASLSSRLATIDIGRKLGAPFLGGDGELGPQHKVAWAEAYLHTKWHLNPSNHLATTDMDRRLGEGLCPFRGELGPHLTQCGQGQGLPACQVSS